MSLFKSIPPSEQYSFTVEETTGKQEWWLNSLLHRTDGPAIEYAGGGEEWWLKGKRHRKDGPAWTSSEFGEQWWQNGQLHRLDGPAVIAVNGMEHWYMCGKNFRADGGPTIVDKQSAKRMWWDGELDIVHRDDGPAIVWGKGKVSWIKNGVNLTGVEYEETVKRMAEKLFNEENIDDIPFSEIESFVYTFNGWERY
jgi:hypothetical protein